MDQKERIINIWKSKGFVGISKMKKILKEMNVDIKNNDLKSILQEQKINQIHKKFNKNKKVLEHVFNHGVNNNWQLDISDMSQYSNQNNGYKFILLAIDIITRKAFAQPLKNKTEKTIIESFNKMVDNDKSIILKIDIESEFKNKEINNTEDNEILLNDINVGDHYSLGIIDKLSKTLIDLIHKYFTENNTVKWVEHLPKLIEIYNNTPNSGLPHGISPNQILLNCPELINQNLEKANAMNEIKPDVHVGDIVKIKLLKMSYPKEDICQYSSDVFKVLRVMKVSVILEDGNRVKISDIQIVSSSSRDELPFSNPKPKPKPKPKAKSKSESKPSDSETSGTENKKEKNIKKININKKNINENKRKTKKTKTLKSNYFDESTESDM